MIEAVVTDIEGTTSSLSFVKEVLFPYAREHLGDYLASHRGDPPVAEQLREVRTLMGDEAAPLEAVIGQLRRWIDEDRKVTPLKALQGLVWEDGYRQGAFSGHVYDDAVAVLGRWCAQGLRLYVYSSGSAHAQRLLFAHTAHGDLTPWFSGYYDTRVGAKVEAASYRAIAADIGLPPERILFLSDIERELDAARAAGLRTCQVARPGETLPSPFHPSVTGFAGIDLRALGQPAAAGTA